MSEARKKVGPGKTTREAFRRRAGPMVPRKNGPKWRPRPGGGQKIGSGVRGSGKEGKKNGPAMPMNTCLTEKRRGSERRGEGGGPVGCVQPRTNGKPKGGDLEGEEGPKRGQDSRTPAFVLQKKKKAGNPHRTARGRADIGEKKREGGGEKGTSRKNHKVAWGRRGKGE